MPQLRSEETRSRLLASALECFARSGYDATGVAEICAQAGTSKGAFYHHFPSKQAVFLALLDSWLEALDRRFEDIRASSRSVPQALTAMADAAQQAFLKARGQLPLYMEFYRQSLHDPLLRARTLAPFRRYRQFFAELVRAGIEEGSLRRVDPDAAARTILSMALGMLVQEALIAEEEPAGRSDGGQADGSHTRAGLGGGIETGAHQAVEHLIQGLIKK